MAEINLQVGALAGSENIDTIGIQQPLDPEQTQVLLSDPRFYDLSSFLSSCMFNVQPYSGTPFTQIDCKRLGHMLKTNGLVLDPLNVARTVEASLAGTGEQVYLDETVKPLQPGHYLFDGRSRIAE
jgi:hypothetical protein